MRFFVPQSEKPQMEADYQLMKDTIFRQFRLPMEDSRIFSLSYTNSKKNWLAQVGELELQERRYQIMAIFESKQFVIVTRTPEGKPGPVILVDKAEVTDVQKFD